MTTRRKILVLTIILALVMIPTTLFGGGAQETTAAPAAVSKVPDTTITFGTSMILRTLDPIKTICWEAFSLTRTIYDTLVVYNPEDPDNPIPSIAERWDVNADATEWIFYLRKGVKFTTGNELTATDVVESFKRGMRLNSPAYMPYTTFIDVDTGFEIIDDYTVKFKLKVPYAGLLHILLKPSGAILDIKTLNQHISKDDELGSLYLNDHSLGSGPFKLKEWIRDERVVLEANEEYWGFATNDPRVPKFKYFVNLNVPSITTQMLMLEKGDIDFTISLTKDMIKQYKDGKNPNIYVEEGMTQLATSFLMHPKEKPFDDPKVRQAVRYAIDYNTIVNNILSAIRMDRPLFKPMIGTDDDILYDTNLEKAKQLMKESKYPNGATFDYFIGTGIGLGAQWEDLGLKIKQDLEKIGLVANIQQYDWSVMDEKMYGGNFVAIENWYGSNFPEAEGMMSMTVRHDSNCLQGIDGYWDFSKVEALADQAMQTTDNDLRYKLYREISEIMAEDGPVAFIAQQKLEVPFRKDVHGWDKSPDYYVWDWAKLYKD